MFAKIFFLLCYLTSNAFTQTFRPSCAQIDFVNGAVLSVFEPCEDLNMLGIKSYEDAPLEPYRSDAKYHLSNIQSGWSCIRTTQTLNLDIYTEIDLIVYLNSVVVDSNPFVEILAFDTEAGDVYTFGSTGVSNDWNAFHRESSWYIRNAKIEIRAFVPADALLAIEYLHITNPTKAEINCRRTTTTTTTTTKKPEIELNQCQKTCTKNTNFINL